MLSLCANVAIAEDITQDTFLKAIKNIRSFDDKKDIKAWLFTIARNTYFTQYNREKIYADSELISNDVKDNSNNILDNLIDKQQVRLILKTLHEIHEPYKEVFMLRLFGELSYSQIGEIFEKTEVWARVTFFRAKKLILEKMEEKSNA